MTFKGSLGVFWLVGGDSCEWDEREREREISNVPTLASNIFLKYYRQERLCQSQITGKDKVVMKE